MNIKPPPPSKEIKPVKPSAKYAELIERQRKGEFKTHDDFLKEAAKVCQSSPIQTYLPPEKPKYNANPEMIDLDELLKNIEII